MKNTIKNIAIYSTAAFMLFATASCKKDFLDVNTNETTPEQVDVKYALPSAQSYLGYTVGNQLSLVGGFWAQYWTQGPNASQYAALDQYVYNSTEADRPWAALYAGTLKDLDFIYKTGQTDVTKKNYAAIARILQAYTYQVITDAWGDAPFSESLQGDKDLVSPRFDNQQAIYDGILAAINEGQAMLDDEQPTPGTDDLIFNGDLFLWYEFGNTLKLKVLLRQSEIRPSVAQAGIAEMFANGEPFLEQDAKLFYNDVRFQQSPLYTTANALGTSSNIFASATIVDYMSNTNDERLGDYFDPNGGGQVVGLEQGSGKLLGGNQTDDTWSRPAEQIIGPTAATTLISVAESDFLQAEAIARGWGSGDDEAAYYAGIEASWANWAGASAGDVATFEAGAGVVYPTGGTQQDKLTAIFTQKWVAMAGNQNFEGWTEWRRTGIPAFTPSATSVLGGNTFPARLVYPSDEVTSNQNFPGIKPVTEKMWWDVN
ncbi:MAG TPA: SusD/RagB family nutrient-binding outer membrane lipoprotein [Chitinophagales bacterium]|nr:SusD/RagB family nutrient-binding outer membrane lipoprotein [Chitinophagales bacterium]